MAKLFVIAGHGAGDPGACSDGYSEADLVRKLAAILKTRGGDDVEVGDTRVNWFASDYISKGMCPKGIPVIELHMDSASDASAKGGHVIIKDGLAADKYDSALATFVSGYFPGRSVVISKRSNIANANRSYRMGVNYRLLENCFISNDDDRTRFINNMDEVANGILAAFGINVEPEVELPPLPDVLAGYKDLDPTAWYIEPLAKAVEAGYIHGYSDTAMAPSDPITRGQAVVVIANAADFVADHPYSDVVASPYYYDAVEWAKDNSIINGSIDNFRPDDPCTREEFMTMLYNWKGTDAPDPTGISDWDRVSQWAKPAVAWAVSAGVASGVNGMIMPLGRCSRVEAATMLVNLLQK